jgi:dCTP deaminase
MIVNGTSLLTAAPIKDMLDHKVQHSPGSYGLTEAGYDIRIKQQIDFHPIAGTPYHYFDGSAVNVYGRFCLASSVEEFQMPDDLVARVSNKSTWARLGVDAAFSTVIEPGWRGFLTLELVFHGDQPVTIPAGSGIVQVLFEELRTSANYVGKYQDQPDAPTSAKI